MRSFDGERELAAAFLPPPASVLGGRGFVAFEWPFPIGLSKITAYITVTAPRLVMENR